MSCQVSLRSNLPVKELIKFTPSGLVKSLQAVFCHISNGALLSKYISNKYFLIFRCLQMYRTTRIFKPDNI